jgi:hypothetical protein
MRERERRKMKRERRRRKEKKKGNLHPPYVHKPLFKKRRRLSPPQASLGDS